LEAVRDVVLRPRRGRQAVAQGVSPGIDDLQYEPIKAPEGRQGSSMAEGPCRPSGAREGRVGRSPDPQGSRPGLLTAVPPGLRRPSRIASRSNRPRWVALTPGVERVSAVPDAGPEVVRERLVREWLNRAGIRRTAQGKTKVEWTRVRQPDHSGQPVHS